MARTTQETSEANLDTAVEPSTDVDPRVQDRPSGDQSVGATDEGVTTEQAKQAAVTGDPITTANPSGEGEIFVGSVTKVSDEETAPPETYNGQCSLCAQSYTGEDQQEITDQLNAHYRAAHVYFDGSGL